MKITMKYPKTGELKEIPTGFSWTTFFFGVIPAATRGDVKNGVLMSVSAIFTFGLAWLVWPFVYNKVYKASLIGKGWVVNGASTVWDPEALRPDQLQPNGGDDPIARYIAKKEAAERAERAAADALPALLTPAYAAPLVRTFGRKV